MFYVGQKVVCVDATLGKYLPLGFIGTGDLHGLEEGGIYTVKSTYQDPHTMNQSIRLVEITRGVCARLGFEAGFDHRRFRPLVERKTDISCFTAMLNTAKTLERV